MAPNSEPHKLRDEMPDSGRDAPGRGAQIIDMATGNLIPERAKAKVGENRPAFFAGLAGLVVLGGLLVWAFWAQGGDDPRRADAAGQDLAASVRSTLPDANGAAFDPAADARSGASVPGDPASPGLTPPAPSPVLSYDPGAVPPPPELDVELEVAPLPQPATNRHAAPAVVFDGGKGPGSAVLIGDGAPVGDAVQEVGSPAAAKPAASAPAKKTSAPQRGATVARGTLIPAVLETAIDTDEPGFVRAMVTTDVKSYDGKRTLVPRSSKLIGQYRADTSNGKKQAYVIWTRLEPPSGRSVALAPTVGKDDFFARFDGAKLMSIVGGQSVTAGKNGPRVRVRQGEPVRVFTAKDIDLSKN
ncbi:MAG: TrbI/VirB10 family protein [Sphingomonadaceae bacterium]